MLPLNFGTVILLLFFAFPLSYACMFVTGFIIMPIFKGTILEKLFEKLMENNIGSFIFFYLLGLACVYFVFWAAYTGGGPDLPEGPTRQVGPFEF